MTIGIYKFTNKINNKAYIGQSVNIEKRYTDHFYNYTNENGKGYPTKFYRSIRKYGWDSYLFEIIEVIDDINILDTQEQYWINHCDSFQNGYNSNEGGKFVTGRNQFHPMSILTDIQAQEIKILLATTNTTQKEIGLQYNVNQAVISNINTGKHWQTVGDYQYPIRNSNYNHRKGSDCKRAIFDDSEIIIIRTRYINETIKKIYEDYKDKCSYTTIERILLGQNYKHLPVYRKTLKIWN